MEKKILSLGSDGKLVVKSPDGREVSVSSSGHALVYLLIDCSGSMYGEKISQVKQGALEFSRTALRKGYLTGLIRFDTTATLLCEPTANFSLISRQTEELIADGGTSFVPPLTIASQKLVGCRCCRVIVVATDGAPHDPDASLEIAGRMKRDGIEILAISTEDANQDFLSKLVSRKDLNLRVRATELKMGFSLVADKLPYKAIGYQRK